MNGEVLKWGAISGGIVGMLLGFVLVIYLPFLQPVPSVHVQATYPSLITNGQLFTLILQLQNADSQSEVRNVVVVNSAPFETAEAFTSDCAVLKGDTPSCHGVVKLAASKNIAPGVYNVSFVITSEHPLTLPIWSVHLPTLDASVKETVISVPINVQSLDATELSVEQNTSFERPSFWEALAIAFVAGVGVFLVVMLGSLGIASFTG